MSESATHTHGSWHKHAHKALATLRIVLGLIFLWAFLDKNFGLEYTSTTSWMFGTGDGNPTKGYLGGSTGPLADVFKDMAGTPLVNWLFMLGLLCVGLSMTTGAASRIGAFGGTAMVLLMYISHPVAGAEPHQNHPFLDEHITEAAAFVLLALTPSGDTWGLGTWWRSKVKATWLH